MKHRTADLSGRRLDAAVALACRTAPVSGQPTGQADWRPSTDWAQGGPIIERERVSVAERESGEWVALIRGWHEDVEGPTHLIAAMRAFVASRLGTEIDLP